MHFFFRQLSWIVHWIQHLYFTIRLPQYVFTNLSVWSSWFQPTLSLGIAYNSFNTAYPTDFGSASYLASYIRYAHTPCHLLWWTVSSGASAKDRVFGQEAGRNRSYQYWLVKLADESTTISALSKTVPRLSTWARDGDKIIRCCGQGDLDVGQDPRRHTVGWSSRNDKIPVIFDIFAIFFEIITLSIFLTIILAIILVWERILYIYCATCITFNICMTFTYIILNLLVVSFYGVSLLYLLFSAHVLFTMACSAILYQICMLYGFRILLKYNGAFWEQSMWITCDIMYLICVVLFVSCRCCLVVRCMRKVKS